MCNFEDLEDVESLLEYADPVIFDAENKEFEPDGQFYVELARQTSGPVLELGCGTGRLTIPFAQQGIDITVTAF